MTRTWAKRAGGFIETEGKFKVVVDNVDVLPVDGEPEQIIVRFRTDDGSIINNNYRIFKKDGSENFGAIRAFEALLTIRYGDVEVFSWSAEELVGLPVEITVEANEWNDKLYYNVMKVESIDTSDDI